MSLTENHKRQLRKLGHALKPVVTIGNNGFTAAVGEELDNALEHHELVKVRVNAADRDERSTIVALMCQRSQAQLIQRIGHVALLYRHNKKSPRITL